MSKNFDSWEDKFFRATLCVSLAIHVIVGGYLYLKQSNFARRKQIEVFYEKNKPIEKEIEEKKEITQQVQVLKREPVVKQIEILSKKADALPDFLDSKNSIEKMDTPLKIGKKENPIRNNKDLDRMISIPFLESEKISNPSYVQYNGDVRNQIRQSAFKVIKDVDKDLLSQGSVYLTFVLTADGKVKDIKVIESRSNATKLLYEVAIKSIKGIEGFDAFPKDLKYQELTFSIVISFEVNK